MLYSVTFVLAFSSIVYELLLGQTLAAFLGNTVLRLSVTVGLYMLSMGAGALLARKRVLAQPGISLQRVEIGLTILGALALPALFVLDSWGVPPWGLSAAGHSLIVVIGVLTGLELPLLLEIGSREDRAARDRVLGVDYAGAFAGTLVFAFWFYPRAGLVETALLVATLNAVAGVAAAVFLGRDTPGPAAPRLRLLAAQVVLLAATGACLLHSGEIGERCIGLYLGGAS